MGKTLSTKNANGTLSKVRVLNADVSAEYIDDVYLVASGNGDKYWTFNNTYKAENHDTGNEKEIWLRNYDESIGHSGATIAQFSAGDLGSFDSSENVYYSVWGAPQKFCYDVSQKYNNCGVDSALNILAMAGKIDVIEKGGSTEYQQYLDTPYKYKTDSMSGEKVPVYHTAAKTDSEDAITLWALKNGYAIKTANDKYYVNGEDIYFEDGGTSIEANNFQNWWDTVLKSTCDIITDYSKKSVIATAQSLNVFVWPDEEEEEEAPEGGEGEEEGESEEGELILSNNDKHAWAKQLLDAVQEGEGVIVSGNAYALLGEGDGFGGHAMTVVGAVTGTTIVSDDLQFGNDIQGFFVVDTGGWLHTEGATFITVDVLYDFLTASDVRDGEVVARWNGIETETRSFQARDSEGNLLYNDDGTALMIEVTSTSYTSKYVCTQNHIKAWADALNLEGNKQMNFLYGNDAVNTIRGGKSDDALYGRGGNDKLYGDEDNDTLVGGAGDDYLNGGSGNDTYVFCKSDGVCHDTIVLGSGKDTIYFSSELDLDNPDSEVPAVQWDEMTFYKTASNDLVIEYCNGTPGVDENSTLTVKGYFKNTANNLGFIKIDSVKSSKTLTVREYFAKTGLTKSGIEKSGISKTRLAEKITADNPITNREYLLAHGYDKERLDSLASEYEIYADWFDEPVEDELGIPEEIAFNTFINSQTINYIPYQDRANKLTGSSLNDSIVGAKYNDTITGGAGRDTLFGGAGDDVIKAGSGYDVVYGSYGSDKIYGEKGETHIIYDSTRGYNGSDTIYSGKGEDILELKEINSSAVKFARSGNNLILLYTDPNGNEGNSITITDYFKNGSSVKQVIFANDRDSLDKFVIASGYANSSKTVGTIGNDSLTGTAASDVINGGFGNDTIKAGKGDDVLIGGKGNDKLYGQGGNNIYRFNLADGNDTIYTSGSGSEVIQFSDGSDKLFTREEVANFEYTKKGNDLIINYGSDETDKDISKITVSGYFKSKRSFSIECSDGYFALSSANVIIEGLEGKKNKLTGSALADVIIGKELADTIKGGAGNDTITGGEGNDTITGGAGYNTINYTKGDGNDIINLTKGEYLTINLDGFNSFEDLSFAISGKDKDLVISYVNDEFLETTQKITLKKYAKSNTTQMVKLNINGETYELPSTDLGFYYNTFSTKKYKYTGNWLSETIDARRLSSATDKKGRGVNINANSGNDTIYGSNFNDTIKGGTGDDVIVTTAGTNKVDGGEGNDTYYVLANKPGSEFTKITDTGSSNGDIVYLCNDLSSDYELWFDIARGATTANGISSISVYKDDTKDPYVSMTGIETVMKLGENGDLRDDPTQTASEDWQALNYEALLEAVNGWFSGVGSGYYSTSDVLNGVSQSAAEAKEALVAIFKSEDIWSA